MKKAKKCINCKHRGNIFYLSPKRQGLPHCHCHHPDIPATEFGWETLREALKALRHDLENEFAATLFNVDIQIEEEKAGGSK